MACIEIQVAKDMACIEIQVANNTPKLLEIEATHICSVDTVGYTQLVASDGPILTADGKPIFVKIK